MDEVQKRDTHCPLLNSLQILVTAPGTLNTQFLLFFSFFVLRSYTTTHSLVSSTLDVELYILRILYIIQLPEQNEVDVVACTALFKY